MTQQISVAINDREFDVVARNNILLLLALATQVNTEAKETTTSLDTAEALLHLWYSASIPSGVLSWLEDTAKPLIVDVCKRIANKPPDSILGKTWTFSAGRTLRLVLKQKDWLRLGDFLELGDMTTEGAARIRAAVTLADERADYRDRWYFKDASPFMRIAKQRFQEDGLLLPFGHPRVEFDRPNP